MNDTSEHKKIKIKIGVMGDVGVGKSTLINLFFNSASEAVQQSKLKLIRLFIQAH